VHGRRRDQENSDSDDRIVHCGGMFAYDNFSEKQITDAIRINGNLMSIDIGITYMFMKESRYLPYLVLRGVPDGVRGNGNAFHRISVPCRLC